MGKRGSRSQSQLLSTLTKKQKKHLRDFGEEHPFYDRYGGHAGRRLSPGGARRCRAGPAGLRGLVSGLLPPLPAPPGPRRAQVGPETRSPGPPYLQPSPSLFAPAASAGFVWSELFLE